MATLAPNRSLLTTIGHLHPKGSPGRLRRTTRLDLGALVRQRGVVHLATCGTFHLGNGWSLGIREIHRIWCVWICIYIYIYV